MAVAEGIEVASAQPRAAWETLGVNSRGQLAELERILQRERADRLLEQGVTIDEMVVNHRARKYGSSKYDLGKLVNHTFDLMVGFSTRPLRIIGNTPKDGIDEAARSRCARPSTPSRGSGPGSGGATSAT